MTQFTSQSNRGWSAFNTAIVFITLLLVEIDGVTLASRNALVNRNSVHETGVYVFVYISQKVQPNKA